MNTIKKGKLTASEKREICEQYGVEYLGFGFYDSGIVGAAIVSSLSDKYPELSDDVRDLLGLIIWPSVLQETKNVVFFRSDLYTSGIDEHFDFLAEWFFNVENEHSFIYINDEVPNMENIVEVQDWLATQY